MASASSDLLEAVGRFDEHRLWRNDGATSMTPWLAGRYCLTWGTAREWVIGDRLAWTSRHRTGVPGGSALLGSTSSSHPLRHVRERRSVGAGGSLHAGLLTVARGQAARADAHRGSTGPACQALLLDVVGSGGPSSLPRGDAPRRARCRGRAGAKRAGGAGCPRGGPGRTSPGGTSRRCAGRADYRIEQRRGRAGHARGPRRSRRADSGGTAHRTLARRDRVRDQDVHRSSAPPGMRREDRVGARVEGPHGGDRPAGPGRAGRARSVAAPPGSELPFSRVRENDVAERAPPDALGEGRLHRLREPDPAVSQPPSLAARRRVDDEWNVDSWASFPRPHGEMSSDDVRVPSRFGSSRGQASRSPSHCVISNTFPSGSRK